MRLHLVFLLLAGPAIAAEKPIDYARDIRPILSDACFHCHGPDAATREAKLRLDTAEGLFTERDGIFPFRPGKVEESDAWVRILSTDKDEMMPPPKAHKTLSEAQRTLIKKWIEQGAAFKEHWAFTTPKRAALPAVKNAWWPRNGLDHFIAAELEGRGLQANGEAPKELLLRRVTLDLTGLPPTPAEVDLFLADTSPDAYERVVDRLLTSPRLGEHFAHHWLDLARYGDTHGLHLDNERSMWPYRDWVVRAFNENLPFDQFTIWQLAGDLLPEASRDQRIASGFSRCNVTTSEGGAINDEFIFRYAVDRTETMAGVWMGLTAGCATCHDHKFDPIAQKEFYQLYAFFNSAADPAMDGNIIDTAPILKLTTPEQEKQLAETDTELAAVELRLKEAVAKVDYTDPATLDPLPPVKQIERTWVDDAFPAEAEAKIAGEGQQWVVAADAGAPLRSGTKVLKRKGTGIAQDYFEGLKTPLSVPAKGRIFAHVWLDPLDPPKAVMLQWHTDGWKHRANWGDADAITFGTKGTLEKLQRGDLPPLGEWVRLEVPVEDLKLAAGTKFTGLAFTQYGGTVYWDDSGVAYEENPVTDTTLSLAAWEKANQGKDPGDKVVKEVRDIFKSVKVEDRKPEQTKLLREYFLTKVFAGAREVFDPIDAERKKLEERKKGVEGSVAKTFIMADLPKKRQAHIMERGQYNKPGEAVQPGVPAIFPPMANKETANRLDLARWLTAPEHPLTARVTVNRFWQQFFGTGLVKTSGDFGNQGDAPSHAELLDWLAVEFREGVWDMKKFVRMLVTSATYRQDSRATPAGLEADPENRLLARGARFRLDAEAIRDNALYVSGLIDLTMGGKGVRPYQPGNIWEPVGFVGSNTRDYKQDTGSALYRRSLYTFYKRTAPAPAMTTFDAPPRESFCTKRERSNTPLQALLLMNDIQHVEAARALAQRMIAEGGITPEERITHGFRLVTARRPLDPERTVLKQAYEQQLARYAANPESAKAAINVGESKPSPELNPSELAAFTLVANVLLNMDETVTKN